MNIKQDIVNTIQVVASEGGKTLVDSFGDDTVLLESGLDSLDFAILVARLEEELNADPFSAMDEPVYPRTLADFVAIYEQHFAKTA